MKELTWINDGESTEEMGRYMCKRDKKAWKADGGAVHDIRQARTIQ